MTEKREPAAWAVKVFGRIQKLVVRADVADEVLSKWRENNPEATAVPLYELTPAEKAAPDLLEALEGVMARLVDKHETDDAAVSARAAIARAKGE